MTLAAVVAIVARVIDHELGALEERLARLLAEYHRLRADNDALRRELGRTQEHNRALTARIAAASARLDTLLQRLPASDS